MKETYELAIKWFDALRTGDIERLYTYMDENILWENCVNITGINDVIPWIGTYHGIYEVAQTFDLFKALSVTENFDLGEICVDGNVVIVHGYETQRFIENGNIYHADVLYRMKRDGNKIVEWKAYWDTAEAIAAFKKKQHITDNPTKELLQVAGYGDLNRVKELVEEGVDLNAVDSYAGITALHKACQGGHLEIVRYLIEHGIHINTTSVATGHTALIDAIWFLKVDCCKYLLDQDAAIGIPTNYGFTIDEHIGYALQVNTKQAEKEKLLQIQELVQERRKRDQKKSKTKLFQAVLQNDLQAVKEAVASGADIEARYPIENSFNDGHTALIIACRENEPEIVSYLLEQGADVNAVEPVFGAVPLHKATYNGHAKILQILLTVKGIDVNFQGYTNGYTPIHDALWHGFEICAEMLLDYGVDLQIRGDEGKLPVDIAEDVFGKDARITKRIREEMNKGKEKNE